MPRFVSSDIAHTAVTDHRIPRKPPIISGKPASSLSASSPLVHFHRAGAGSADPDTARALGIALAYLARTDRSLADRCLLQARPLLEQAVLRDPADAVAWETLARLLAEATELDKAVAAAQHAIELAPSSESARLTFANVASAALPATVAAKAWQAVLELNPLNAGYRLRLAQAWIDQGDHTKAQNEARTALRLQPFDLEARRVLIQSLWQGKMRTEAEREWRNLRSLFPEQADRWSDWFEQIKRR